MGRFVPLHQALPGLVESWERCGFDVQLFAQAETLNLWQYACPYCRANDRSRLIAMFIRSQARSITAGERPHMLDIAPSRPLRNMILQMGCYDYRSADLNMHDVDDRIDLTRMDLYDDNRFDCFLCSHVLEHVPDDRAALRELLRVLKPGGWGVVMAPISLKLGISIEDLELTDPTERISRFGQDDHVRLYSRADFLQKLTQAGFAVEERGLTAFGAGTFFANGITQSAVLYVCRKPPAMQ